MTNKIKNTAGRSKAPEAKAPEAKAPETKAPETKAPEAKAPETKAPEAKAPETKAPEAKAPETKAPEAKAPETKAPEAKAKKGLKIPPERLKELSKMYDAKVFFFTSDLTAFTEEQHARAHASNLGDDIVEPIERED